MERDADAFPDGDGDDPGRPVRASAAHRSREILYEEHVLAVYGYLARRVGPQAGEELTAEVFLEAFDGDDLFHQPPASERAGLFAIALKVLRRHQRDGGRRLPPLRRGPRPWPSRRARRAGRVEVGSGGAGPAAHSPMAAALASLPSDECEILLLHAWGELSDVDIAAVLDISTEAVSARLGWARSRLSQAFRGLSPRPRPPGLA